MIEGRQDMTNWVMHFVHNRNPNNDPSQFIEHDGSSFPLHVDPKSHGKSPWDLIDIWDADSPIEPDAHAFTVLRRIILQGFIRASWSFRNKRATIFGPRAACCFSEMPLYALVDYAKARADNKNVDCYAIAFQRHELFQCGARSVIYGLSSPFAEIPTGGWNRLLQPDCGIGEAEQYRFVPYQLGSSKQIDWTHEREWRWPLDPNLDVPGFPVWLPCENGFNFSRILVVVPKASEADRVLELIKELHDGGSADYGFEVDREKLKNTFVIALDQTKLAQKPKAAVRIDDLPACSIVTFSTPEVGDEYCTKLLEALEKATAAAEVAAREHIKKYGDRDVCGFGSIIVGRSQSELVSALLKLGRCSTIGGIGHAIRLSRPVTTTQSLGEYEAAANAAIEVLKKELPGNSFYLRTEWD